MATDENEDRKNNREMSANNHFQKLLTLVRELRGKLGLIALLNFLVVFILRQKRLGII
jgi:hypothetical protein